MKNKFIKIAIDGPGSSGKSTIAKSLARMLNIYYLSTGKIFRSYGAYLAENKIDFNNEKLVKKHLKQCKLVIDNDAFYVNNINFTDKLGDNSISWIASKISTYKYVRKIYKRDVLKLAEKCSVIMDGRDIGTVIFKKADFKFYLTADIKIRAKRRWLEYKSELPFEQVEADLIKRDEQDMNRKISPLKKAKDAIEIDSSNLTVNDVISKMICIIKQGK